MDQKQREQWWKARGRRVALRVNLAWWVQAFIPWILAAGAAAAAGTLVLRLSSTDPRPWLAVSGGILCLGAVIAAIRCRRRFLTARDGLVRLEALHRLYNRLSAAAEGIGEWPEIRPRARDGLRWDPAQVFVRPLAAVLLLATALWVPVREAAQAAGAVEEPLAWREVESWLDALEEEDVVQDEAVAEVRSQVEALRRQPPEQWYTHSSLEASDSLREQTEGSMQSLGRDLQTALTGVAALERFGNAVPGDLAEGLGRELDGALEGLELGAFPLDAELLKQLRAMDLDAPFRTLTEEELRALREALARGLQACALCSGTNACSACGGGACTNACLVAGLTPGGISRGPGPAPLTMSEQETQLAGGQMEHMSNPDFTRATVGDTLAVQEGRHEVDESLYGGPVAAGSAASLGAGGEAVWTAPLMPEEEAVLTRYFK